MILEYNIMIFLRDFAKSSNMSATKINECITVVAKKIHKSVVAKYRH